MDALENLCALLDQIPPSRPLHIKHFEDWKLSIEHFATENEAQNAKTSVQFLLALAQESANDDAIALSVWTSANVHMFLEEPTIALEQYQQAEAIYAKYHNFRAIAHLTVGLISALDQLGRYDEAIVRGRKALGVLQDSQDETDQRRIASLYSNIGISCEHVGRYVEAVDCYEHKARWWYARLGGSQGPIAAIQVARTQINCGSAQKYLGLYVEAHRSFTLARKALAQHHTEGSAKLDLARADMHLAWLEVIRNNRPIVIEAAFNRARASRAEIDPENKSIDLALLDLVEAEWYVRSLRYEQLSQTQLAQLQQRYVQAGLIHEASRADLLLAELELQQKHDLAALARFEAIGHSALTRSDVELVHAAGVGRARALRRMDDVNGAMQVLTQTLSYAEDIRHGLSDDGARAGYLEDKLPAYQALAALQLEQREYAQALQTIERARSRTLVDSFLQTTDGSEPNSLNLDKLFDGLSEGIDAESALVISYAVIQGQVWAFLVNRQGLCDQPRQLGPALTARDLQDGLDRITSISRSPASGIRTTPYYLAQQISNAQRALGMWYDRFVRPLQTWLERYDYLYVVPDGMLNLLPFRCLFDADTGHYLVQTHEVTVLPSLTAWKRLMTRAKLTYSGTTGLAATPLLVVGCSSDGRLTHAEVEARAIAESFDDAILLTGHAATHESFMRWAGGADVIYIASHGAYRADGLQFSYLELADGRLEAREVIEMRLQASAVIVSACETAVGRLTGNEVMGLVRAFLYAGARSVLATHWKVDDAATAQLMTRFARELRRGISVAQSLTAAQRAVIREKDYALIAHPFYWGAHSFVGVDGVRSAQAAQ